MNTNVARWSLALFALGLLCIAVSARADDSGRHIEGGSIIQTSIADGSTADVAQFKARMAAVRALIGECGEAHQEIKFGHGSLIRETDINWKATAEAYITFQDCEEAKHDVNHKFVKNSLVKDQEIYTRMISPAEPEVAEEESDDEEPVVDMNAAYKSTMAQCRCRRRQGQRKEPMGTAGQGLEYLHG
jgi:membrane-bound lytic murein transglycosylase